MDSKPIIGIIGLAICSVVLLTWAATQGGTPLQPAPAHAAAGPGHATHGEEHATHEAGHVRVEEAAHADVATMPEGLARASTEERALYFTPKGGYTAADIRVNGPTVPSEKFHSIRAEHDMNPKPGSRLCPITNTLANAKFGWVVGGKKYQFCCPPCIDEFVHRAKDEPASVRPPEAYVKR